MNKFFRSYTKFLLQAARYRLGLAVGKTLWIRTDDDICSFYNKNIELHHGA